MSSFRWQSSEREALVQSASIFMMTTTGLAKVERFLNCLIHEGFLISSLPSLVLYLLGVPARARHADHLYIASLER
jgi:hypothetical protein